MWAQNSIVLSEHKCVYAHTCQADVLQRTTSQADLCRTVSDTALCVQHATHRSHYRHNLSICLSGELLLLVCLDFYYCRKIEFNITTADNNIHKCNGNQLCIEGKKNL